jgi:hypothetical protein
MSTLDKPKGTEIISTMAKQVETMSVLIRKALAKAPSVRAVARATGTNNMALARFKRGDGSMRLDLADRLASYFGIVSMQTKKER